MQERLNELRLSDMNFDGLRFAEDFQHRIFVEPFSGEAKCKKRGQVLALCIVGPWGGCMLHEVFIYLCDPDGRQRGIIIAQ